MTLESGFRRGDFTRVAYALMAGADPKDPNSLSSNSVLSIYEDEAEVLWIGTGGGGLNMFNRKDEEFEYFGWADNFPNQVFMEF